MNDRLLTVPLDGGEFTFDLQSVWGVKVGSDEHDIKSQVWVRGHSASFIFTDQETATRILDKWEEYLSKQTWIPWVTSSVPSDE